ncbi:hypothetical protein GGR55DRAFT_73152 [Xylaria sp. FL0064]|nr:hypothetical protein GGR55DRAFT_73152 [Xylaria sp. FL0064]
MPKSPIVRTLIQSSARVASRDGRATTSRVSQRLRRTYATDPGPPPPPGNRPLIIAALIGIPTLVYFMIPSRPVNATAPPRTLQEATQPPNLDPAAVKRHRDAHEPDEGKYVHPENMNPEEFRPPFGQLHKKKRVDTPPDNKHHQALNDRAKAYD